MSSTNERKGRGSAAVIAYGASSALGDGDAAFGIGAVGDVAPVAVARDPELVGAGLLRPFCARVHAIDENVSEADRATVLLERALAACAKQLDAILPDWRKK